MSKLRSIVSLLWLVLVLAGAPGTAYAEIRALVVGTDYLESGNPALILANPVADARLVDAALRRTAVGEVDLLEDPGPEAWTKGFDAFAGTLTGDDIALFYYAGHGLQIGGINYLIAADGRSLIALDPLIQQMSERSRGVVVIIDACRNNPFAEKTVASGMEVRRIAGATREVTTVEMDRLSEAGSGLAQLANLRGMSAVVFFSTEPGNVAEDGDTPGKGSPFAKAFIREIVKRQSLDETFRKTAVAVNDATAGRQSPWRQGDLPFNVFLSGMRTLPIP